MNKVMNKKAKTSGGVLLYRLVGFLLVLTMVSVWFVCGLFAKYTTSAPSKDNAHVAGTGVKQLEVKEHKAQIKDPKEDNYDDDLLYKLLAGTNNEVTKNEYEKVMPGVDIPKDPFVRIELVNAEVDYYLYLKVVESKEWPSDDKGKTVTYDIDPTLWDKVNTTDQKVDEDGNNIFYYKYKGYFDAGTNYQYTTASAPNYPSGTIENKTNEVIHILKDNKLYVSERYVGFKLNADGSFELEPELDESENPKLDADGNVIQKKIPIDFWLTFEVYLVQVD